MSPLFAAFCSGSNQERSSSIDNEKTVNLFRSTTEMQGAAKTACLLGTPGLKPLTTVAASGCRGLFTQDGRTWAVIGDQLYPVTVDAANVIVTAGASLGTILSDGALVSFASNGDGGTQLAIVGGGQLKILNLQTNVLSAAILLPLTKAPTMIGYLDAYFILAEANSPILWFSALVNGTSWDALDFFTRSTASDYVVGMRCALSRCWVFGSETSEAYEDVGDADNPFQPIKGSLFSIGLAARWGIGEGPNTLWWLGRSRTSGPAVYRLNGYGGTRISTHAIEAQLSKGRTLTDAETLVYEQEGHLFCAFSCPSVGDFGLTPVWDESEQQWHHRSAWNSALAREELWRPRGHACVGNLHLVGSRDSGAIWALDLDTYDDDGQILRAVRRAPYLGAESVVSFVDKFELGVEPGVGLQIPDISGGYFALADGPTLWAASLAEGTPGTARDATVELRVSKDAGKTWFSAGAASFGQAGEYDHRTMWTRLGQARIDRLIFEIIQTDAVRRVLGPGCWLTFTAGRQS